VLFQWTLSVSPVCVRKVISTTTSLPAPTSTVCSAPILRRVFEDDDRPGGDAIDVHLDDARRAKRLDRAVASRCDGCIHDRHTVDASASQMRLTVFRDHADRVATRRIDEVSIDPTF
jgi:hypothetical protein